VAGAEGGWGGRFLLLGLMLRRFCGGVGVFHAPSPDFFAQDDTAAAGVVGDDGEAVAVCATAGGIRRDAGAGAEGGRDWLLGLLMGWRGGGVGAATPAIFAVQGVPGCRRSGGFARVMKGTGIGGLPAGHGAVAGRADVVVAGAADVAVEAGRRGGDGETADVAVDVGRGGDV
jgi:hypothetical protein